MKHDDAFPRSLRAYRSVIEDTVEPTVLMSLQPQATRLQQSKIGGVPYFPLDYPPETVYTAGFGYDSGIVSPWPKHRGTGRELMLLLQLNFEEMPRLPSFPTTGILQLFVDDDDWHDLGRELRAVYHRHVIQDDERLCQGLEEAMPDSRVPETALSFARENEFMTSADFRIDPELERFIFKQDAAWRDFLKITHHRHHGNDEVGYGKNKIGGYHYSQNDQDPRHGRRGWEDSMLLVQFCDFGALSWGDGGSAQFFIKRKDLERLHFGDLLFHWDST